jgi:hypothetical protein
MGVRAPQELKPCNPQRVTVLHVRIQEASRDRNIFRLASP